jgi:predicted PurR-regulated permease PerM
MTGDREDGLRRLGVAAWSLLGTILLLGVASWLVLQVWIIVPPIVLAIAIVYVLNPVVNALHGRGIARWLGSCLSYIVLLGLLTAVGFLVIPGLAEQGGDLVDDFPDIYDGLVVELEDLAGRVGINIDLPDYESARDGIGTGFLADRFDRITTVALGVLEILFLMLLAPVVAFYVLLDLPTARRKATDLLPEHLRAEVAHVGRQLGMAVGGFIRGQLLVALIVGIMSAFGLWLVGVPFWLLIGLIAGFLNIIPFVGPWVGGTLGVLVALATRDLQTAVWAALVAVIVQQIESNVISPAVLRATVRLHPATILLGLVAAATLGGFWGMLMAVPAIASVKIITGHFWRTRVLGQSWDEASEALIDENPTGETFLVRIRRGEGDDEGAVEIEAVDLSSLPGEPPEESETSS